MFKHALVGLMIASASLAGCAVGGEEVEEAELALEDHEDSDGREGGGDQLALEGAGEAPDPLDRGRACTQAEWNVAEHHAWVNHGAPGHVSTITTVTSCTVSNGWIVYTYTYP
ncbi:hypothetical protein [Polyangium mundeleinium]|uniref:Lipoprotein n=1 Tax=Polyangium mundeleinium TaxID=2995306 RepID=A0ABT5EYV0_9BACT|nr:hypothetical protein [Polyangium mundeleinium]MDC0746534.1 hypothetical protein [Polyangium mundeleinium]